MTQTPFKIGIVGCDGRSIKTKEQEVEIKVEIERILRRHGNKISPPKIGWNVFDPKLLVLVSGGCPVGTKHFYCINCDVWILPSALKVHNSIYPNHKGLEVYNQGGVDTFAEIIATKLGISTDIKRPEVHQFSDKIVNFCIEELGEECTFFGEEDECLSKEFCKTQEKRRLKGFCSRNIDIIETIPNPPNGVLYDIEVKGNCKHCGEKGKRKRADEEGDGWYYELCKWCQGTGTYSGGTWTYREALKRGKEAYQVVIE